MIECSTSPRGLLASSITEEELHCLRKWGVSSSKALILVVCEWNEEGIAV